MKQSLDGFDAVVDKAIKDFKVPGLAIAVVKDGEVIYARGFGQRDVEKGLPVTPRTLFAIGSCTKAFTTFVMGTLVDEGKLEWDTPVRTYLPGFRMSDPIATESITPRDLVTHRSGLPRHDLVWYNTRLTGKDVFVAAGPLRAHRAAPQQVPVQQHDVHARRLPDREGRRPPVGGGRPRRIFAPAGHGLQQFLRARLAEIRRLRPPV